jgi:hypothetical protein
MVCHIFPLHSFKNGGYVMRILIGLSMAAMALATAASAQPRLSDPAYVDAARCAGLASSKNLASSDAAAMKALVSSQSAGRDPLVLDQADEATRNARVEADRAGPEAKAHLESELAGRCASLKG